MSADRLIDARTARAANLRKIFTLDTTAGRLTVVTAALVLITPALSSFLTRWFLVLLVLALGLSVYRLFQSETAREARGTRLARAGFAMAMNGALLIAGLFIDGILGDFFFESREGMISTAVGLGFTTVHVMLGLGLLLFDDYRHARRADI